MSYLETIAAATSIPLETLSVAATAVPKSVPVLSNIFKISTDIHETTERVETNKTQCTQLSERIDTLIGFLAQRDLSEHLNEALHIALHRFETFLQRCLEFISTFLETTWLKRVVNNKDYERKFQDLNRELTQYSNDLNFGIGLSNMKVKKVEQDDEGEEQREVQTKDIAQDKTKKNNKEQINIDDNLQIKTNLKEPSMTIRSLPIRVNNINVSSSDNGSFLLIDYTGACCECSANTEYHFRIWPMELWIQTIQSILRSVSTTSHF